MDEVLKQNIKPAKPLFSELHSDMDKYYGILKNNKY